jgi:hypothetical protein
MSTEKENALTYVSVEDIGNNSQEYLRTALDNVLKNHEKDKEFAQGRTNFQLEKFALLETYTVETAYESVLKSRRQMASGYYAKILEISRKFREFSYRWDNVEDKSQPVEWKYNDGPGGSSTRLLWHDLDQLELESFVREAELEILDRLAQMKHLDRMMVKIVENNGNKVPTRKDMDKTENIYWERRFAEQLGDELIAASLGGASIGNIHSMRRGTSPALVDENNVIKNGYMSLGEAISSPEGRMKFLQDLQTKVASGYEEIMNMDLGTGLFAPAEDRHKVRGTGNVDKEKLEGTSKPKITGTTDIIEE